MIEQPRNNGGKRRATRSAPSEFVYRSAYLHEADLVANEFDRLGVAFYRAQEGPAGVRWAMPVSAAWEPGSCFVVIVPPAHAKRAARIVKDLPVSKDEHPGVWQPGMSDADKQFWRTLAWFSLAAIGAGLAMQLLMILRR